MGYEMKDETSGIVVWDNFASNYDSYFKRYQNLVEHASILKNFKTNRSDRILEIGAGTGRFTSEFTKKAAEVVAVDFSVNSLKINRSRCNCHVILADLCFLPFRPAVFDNAASIGVLQFIPTWKNRIIGLREIRRVLKNKGNFVITVYNYRLIFTNPLLRKFKKYQKEGYRNGTLYYCNFNLAEFKLMLASTFPKILEIKCILILVVLQEFLSRIGMKKIALLLEAFFEKTKLSHLLGSALLAMCQK